MTAQEYIPTSLSIPSSTVNIAVKQEISDTPAASPFRNAELFDIYCSKIQSRLAEHAQKRIHFLQSAHDRLTRLLQTAKDVEDTLLYNELWQHRVAARELLDALQQASPLIKPIQSPLVIAQRAVLTPEESSSPPSKPIPLNPLIGRYPAETSAADYAATERPETTSTIMRNSQSMEALFSATGTAYTETNDPALPRMPRRPLRPLADIESDAVRLRSDVHAMKENNPLLMPQGDLNIPNCLLLRSIACRQRRLEEEGGDTEVAEVTELMEDIVDLLDQANDREYTVALDDDLDPSPTAYQWGELAERYVEMARAQEAFEWWYRHRDDIAPIEIQPLAEAVAAVQQCFNRMLFRVGARDPFQQQLFDELRTWAREAQCFLHSLRPKVPMVELRERAATLEECWDNAREIVLEGDRRQNTVENVISLVSEPGFGSDSEQDEMRLREAVAECKLQKIHSSDRRLRDALLPWGAFLEGDDRFREVMREINLEWERRQDLGKSEEAAENAENSVENVEEELIAVRKLTKGKRCLLLGGTCREENRRKIEDALEMSELVWPSTKPSDPLSKFDTEIRHSDIVALLTRFSRKEWKNAQDICARDGKRFVHLTSGYGVAQVVRHFYTQLCPDAIQHN